MEAEGANVCNARGGNDACLGSEFRTRISRLGSFIIPWLSRVLYMQNIRRQTTCDSAIGMPVHLSQQHMVI